MVAQSKIIIIHIDRFKKKLIQKFLNQSQIIQILKVEMRFTDSNGISYELNEENLTGQVVWSLEASGSITIPRSVVYDSKEYVIVSIHSGSFQRNHKIKAIQFPENSEIRLIESGAFSSSSLELLSLPSSIQKLASGWNSSLSLKFDLKISPNNQYFTYFNNQLLIGHSNSEDVENVTNQNFDTILFSRHIVEKIVIPSFIREIDSYSFSRCKKLKTIEFSDDSNLHLIGDHAFYQSSLKSAIIPKKVNCIGQYAFNECISLKSIEFLCDEEIRFDYQCLCFNHKLRLISCPNSKAVFIDSLIGCLKNISLFLVAGTDLKKLY